MAYATVQQFKDAFPAFESLMLTNLDNPDAVAPVDDRISEALTRASAEIDSYLGVTFDLPFTETPLVLNGKVLDIARYMLDAYDPREDVRQRYEDAVVWLEKIVAGEASLGTDGSGGEVTSDIPLPTYTAQPRVFTLGPTGTLAGY